MFIHRKSQHPLLQQRLLGISRLVEVVQDPKLYEDTLTDLIAETAEDSEEEEEEEEDEECPYCSANLKQATACAPAAAHVHVAPAKMRAVRLK